VKRLVVALLLVVPVGIGVGEVAAHLAPRPPTLQQILSNLDEPSSRPQCHCRVIVLPNYPTREVHDDRGRAILQRDSAP